MWAAPGLAVEKAEAVDLEVEGSAAAAENESEIWRKVWKACLIILLGTNNIGLGFSDGEQHSDKVRSAESGCGATEPH
jgi:hypothetical protein